MKRLIFFVLLIIMSGNVLAIGLSTNPLRPNPRLFEPGWTITKDYTIRNYDYSAEPFIYGSLEEYATLHSIVDHGDEITFSVTLKLPDVLEPAGMHELNVGAQEIAPEREGIYGLTKVINQILVRVLYDEIAAGFTSLATPHVNENEKKDISFQGESFSKQYMSGMWGDIEIYDYNKELRKTIRTETFSLDPGEKKRIDALFDSTGLTPGQYFAKATVHWYDNTTTLESTFNIGTLDVDVIDFTKNFTAGQINRINVTVESKWNGKINRIYAKLFLDDKEFEATQTYTLNPFEKKKMVGFLDLTFIEGGTHKLKIVLKFDTLEKIIEEDIFVEGKGKKKPFEFPEINAMTIMMITTIFVLLIIVILFFIETKKRKKKNKK